MVPRRRELFGGLPDALRRPVEIFGVLHLATNADELVVTDDHEPYATVRPDGTRCAHRAPGRPEAAGRRPDSAAAYVASHW